MMDVAGLIPGAHKGLGRGNQFLDDLRQANVLIHVIDVAGTTNEKGESVKQGEYDPANDIKFLEEELDYWYLAILKKGWETFARSIQQTHGDVAKALNKNLSGLGVNEEMINETLEKLAVPKDKIMEWTDDELFKLAVALRKLTKPMIIACNKVDMPNGPENFARLQNEFPDHMLVACSAESELALREAAKAELIDYVPGDKDFTIKQQEKLNEKQTKALDFIKKNILEKIGSTGVQETLNDAVFTLLKYIAIFPGGVNKLEDQHGNVLPDCFLMPPNSTALDFAFQLHTDIGEGFIRGIDVKTKRTVGKEHLLNHRDVIEIATSK